MEQVNLDKAQELIVNSGSATNVKDQLNNTLTLNATNEVSSWVFGTLTKPITVTDQVKTAINLDVRELAPAIPSPTVDTVSTDTYNSLLSQSIDLQTIVTELREQITTLDGRVSSLEGQVDSEISERTATEQTNQVLLNQLDSLSGTINGFADQIATALQKSVEESIYRTSLQAQNEGFRAQINALLSQIDSLNTLITGLYAQLGAVQIQRDIEDIADAQARAKEGWSINSVVVIPDNPGECYYPDDGNLYRLIGRQSNFTLNAEWRRGGALTFVNYNKVPVRVVLEIRYPVYDYNTTPIKIQKFFTFDNTDFNVGAGGSQRINTKFLTSIYADKNAKSKWYTDGKIKITVYNDRASTVREEIIPLLYGVLHPDSYGNQNSCP